ncbi:MAG: fibrillarin-like rRNA/tRNA 2'-O-methyltransferase [Thermoplasmata archaeon]
MNKTHYYGVYENKGNLFTKSLVPGSEFGEKTIKENGTEYRQWDPFRSKLSAAIKKNLKNYPYRDNTKILYLGASFGNTVSFLSDICFNGKIFAVEFAMKPFASLIHLSERRKNIFPIMEDASFPEKYKIFIEDPDVIYQDIAQRDQVTIFLNNFNLFSSAKFGFLFLKTRAIDAVTEPEKVMREQIRKINNVQEILPLNPFERDHYLIVVKR